jgi:hypothetical protein
MASTAISTQGTLVKIGTGSGSAKTITAISKALPCVITSAAHGLANGDVVALAAIVGMAELNGVSAVIGFVTTNSFALIHVDSTGFTTYTSGGTATPVTFTQVKNCKAFSGFDGQASEQDVSNFDSTAKEILLGLMDAGSVTFDVDLDHGDNGQSACFAAQQSSAIQDFKITLPAGTTPNITFNGFVKKMGRTGGVDKPYSGQLDIRVSGPITLS